VGFPTINLNVVKVEGTSALFAVSGLVLVVLIFLDMTAKRSLD
jgi:hypothetical protein